MLDFIHIIKASKGLPVKDTAAMLLADRLKRYEALEYISNTEGSYILTDILLNGYTDKAEIDMQLSFMDELGQFPAPTVFGAASRADESKRIAFYAGNYGYYTNYILSVMCGTSMEAASDYVMLDPSGFAGNICSSAVEQGAIDNSTGQPGQQSERVRTADYVEIPVGTTLLYAAPNWYKYLNGSVSPYVYIYQYDADKNYLGYTYVSEAFGSASVDPTAKFVKLMYGQNALGTLTPESIGNGFILSLSPIDAQDINKRGILTVKAPSPSFSATGGTETVYSPSTLIHPYSTLSPTDYEITSPAAVFALNNCGTIIPGPYRQMKIFGIKIYRSNTLTHELVPVQKISDGTKGLFDKTTRKFFPMVTVSGS